jgi:twitching motility protein PilT
MKRIDELLHIAATRDASDLHIKAHSPPLLRIYGELIPLDVPPLSPEEAREISFSVLSDEQRETFLRDWELDLGYRIEGLCRFRVNIYLQRGVVGSAFRLIPLRIRTIDELGLPPVCKYFAERPRGLVLVTGPAGSGKSTTQAAMIDHVNDRFPCHIVTVEDPIEFVHEPRVALVNQRELGGDTRSFDNALKYVLRQDPDVILVGEMRDLDTVALAIRAAETGHLVLGTLHTTDAVQTVDRVIDIFPTYQQQQIRMQLSVNLLGVVSQILVRRADGKGRVAAFETLVSIPAVRASIRERKTHQIASAIQTGAHHGMMTLDQSLASLVRQSYVTYEEAYAKAKSTTEFEQLVHGDEEAQGAQQAASARTRSA